MKRKIIDNAFTHSVAPDGKLEVAILLSNDKYRANVDKVTHNMSLLDVLKDEDKRLSGMPAYMWATYRKPSTPEVSEGPKEFILYKDRVYLSRMYKLVWTDYYKLELTRVLEAWERKPVPLDGFVRLMGKILKWTEKSILPWSFHGGVDWTPIAKYYEKL